MPDTQTQPRTHDQTRSVILRHDLPDATWHLDWMIERDTPGIERRLITFRLDPPQPGTPPPPLDPRTVSFPATRLPDHRAKYLRYQGPLDPAGTTTATPAPDRGSVTRLASAPARILAETDAEIRFECDFPPRTRAFTAIPTPEPGVWTIRARTPSPVNAPDHPVN